MGNREQRNFETLRYLAAKFPSLDFTSIEAYVYLSRVTSDLSVAQDAHFARYDLSKGRFMILIMLMRCTEDGASPADLAEACGVTRATVTGLLDTLEAAGLISREQKEGDRRGLTIRLTERGNTVLNDMLPEHYRRVSSLMSGLTRDEALQLSALLGKVLQNIGELRDP